MARPSKSEERMLSFLRLPRDVRFPISAFIVWRAAQAVVLQMFGGASAARQITGLAPLDHPAVFLWDGAWYQRVMVSGYAPFPGGTQQPAHFFPLLPCSTRAVQFVVRSELAAESVGVGHPLYDTVANRDEFARRLRAWKRSGTRRVGLVNPFQPGIPARSARDLSFSRPDVRELPTRMAVDGSSAALADDAFSARRRRPAGHEPLCAGGVARLRRGERPPGKNARLVAWGRRCRPGHGQRVHAARPQPGILRGMTFRTTCRAVAAPLGALRRRLASMPGPSRARAQRSPRTRARCP
jgi:hypothetical protein